MTTYACPVCLDTSTARAWSYREYRILRCRACDVEFASPFAAARVDEYCERYGNEQIAPRYEEIHPGYRFFIDKVQSAAARLRPDQRRVLDVGCGAGYLLVELHRRGFDCLGIDFNDRLVRAATERFGIPARVDRVENLVNLGERFDLVLLSHVLEHVEQPAGLLRDIHRLLRQGGLLAIEVPNRNWRSLGLSLRGGTCSSGDYPPFHITFWSQRALDQALRRAGFDVLEIGPRPFDDMRRVETFVERRLRLSQGPLVAPAVWALKGLGRLCRLQGGTLDAIAAVREAHPPAAVESHFRPSPGER